MINKTLYRYGWKFTVFDNNGMIKDKKYMEAIAESRTEAQRQMIEGYYVEEDLDQFSHPLVISFDDDPILFEEVN